MSLAPGTKLVNRYLILDQIGKGGMGRVFRAKDLLRDSQAAVAIKELLLRATDSGGADTRFEDDEATRLHLADETRLHHSAAVILSDDQWQALSDQFFTEAKILHNLEHPHLPRVTDYLALDSIRESYLIMELIEGENLEEMLIKQGKPGLPIEDVLGWMQQVLKALTYCHQKSVVHRDVKPGNIILSKNDKVYLVDFGVSQSLVGYTGLVHGTTSGYSAPEQYNLAKTVDATCDIYAAGATLYHLLTGCLPPDSKLRVQGEAQLTPARELNPQIPERVVNAIDRSMDIDPSRRFPSTQKFLEALELPTRPSTKWRTSKLPSETDQAETLTEQTPAAEPELPLPGPGSLNIKINGDQLETWWPDFSRAARYELWYGPQSFDRPVPPAQRMYNGADNLFSFPMNMITKPGFYHFRVRAIEANGRIGDWSQAQVIPFHVPAIEPTLATGRNSGDLFLSWEPVDGVLHYEVLHVQKKTTQTTEKPGLIIENLKVGWYSYKVRPVFAGGATEWDKLASFSRRVAPNIPVRAEKAVSSAREDEPPNSLRPEEISVIENAGDYQLRWYCDSGATPDFFEILDPHHENRILGKIEFQAREKPILGGMVKQKRSEFHWRIPAELRVNGQYFAVRAVKANTPGPLSAYAILQMRQAPRQRFNRSITRDCTISTINSTLQGFLQRNKLTVPAYQQFEMYEGKTTRLVSVSHRPALQTYDFQRPNSYRLLLQLEDGKNWEIEIIYQKQNDMYHLTFTERTG